MTTPTNSSDRRNLLPQKSTLNLSLLDRMLGRTISSKDETYLWGEQGQALDDLLPDLFYEMFKHTPVPMDEPPQERSANRAVLDMIKALPTWEEARSFTTGSISASMLSSEMMWKHIMVDNVFKGLFAKQEKINQQKQQAQQEENNADAYRELAENSKSKNEKQELERQAQQAEQNAEQHQLIADALGQELETQAQKAQKSAFAQAGLNQMVGEAKKQAEEVREAEGVMSGWGSGPPTGGGVSRETLEAYMDKLKGNSGLIQMIASVIGRAKEVAFKAGNFAAPELSFQTADVAPTHDLMNIFPDELAYLRPDAIPFIRAVKVAEWAGEGLMGWIPRTDRIRRGAFVCTTDTSGSMFGGRGPDRFTIAMGLSLAIADVARSENRHYILEQFSNRHKIGEKRVTSKDDWVSHFDWATEGFHGGTDFDLAMDIMMENCRTLYKQGIRGIDALFISDDQADFNRKGIVDEWLAFKEEHDVRLLYISIGSNASKMSNLADKVLNFEKFTLENSDQVAQILGEWMAD